MRIGIDARELLGASTGVGRYLGELLLRWTARDDNHGRTFLLYSPEPLPLHFPETAVEPRIIPGRSPAGLRLSPTGTWWEQVHLRRAVARDRPDVFFAPAYTAPPLYGIPLAVTIHDVAFAAHPEWFRMREGLRRRWITRRSARAASVVFTDSEFSRSEIQSHFQIDGSRIHVIPPGVEPRHRTDAARDNANSHEPLVLYVGSIFTRRRLPDLIAAFARVVREIPQARLAIVGDDRSWPPLSLPDIVASHGVHGRVELRSYVPDTDLAALYGHARVFAFLSEYEGFGLTPLEALAAGVPIVVLDTAVAREVYGDAAEYVRRGDITQTAEVLTRLLRDSGAAAGAMAHAPAVLARYSWDRCADRILELIDGVARR